MVRLIRCLVVPVVCVLTLACAEGSGGHRPDPGQASRPSKPAVKVASVGVQPVASRTEAGTGKSKPAGLVLRIGVPAAADRAPGRIPEARARPLSDADARRLLDRLAPMASEKGSVKPFAFRARSLPRPRTGATVESVFPPAAERVRETSPRAAELTVLRHQPAGDVNLAPNLSLTFSEPMVAVSSHAATLKGGVPVRLEPAVEGAWRWVGSRTLLFEPKPRFPMATKFRVEVPAGTHSPSGAVLAGALRWTFRTPAPRLVERYPVRGPQPREPVIFLGFDQAIDAEVVRARLRLTAGSRVVPVRAATAAEIAADPQVRSLAEAARKGRWLALRPADPLPPKARVGVSVPAGTPSAEGPRTTEADQSFSFRVRGPLEVQKVRCGWRGVCRPRQVFRIRFNNLLDAEALDPAWIRARPEIPGMELQAQGSSLYVRGATRPRTSYEITLTTAITDRHGQHLRKEEKHEVAVGKARRQLWAPGGRLMLLDPDAGGKISVMSVNHKEIRVALYRVEPADWQRFLEFQANGLRARKPRRPKFRAVVDKVVKVRGAPDQLVETSIDLGPALREGKGHVVLFVTEKNLAARPWQRQQIFRWVQVSDIALDAFVDGHAILGWANRLRDGAPLPSVDLRILPDGAAARTDAQGMARLPLPAGPGSGGRILVARSGSDVAMLPERIWEARRSGWTRREDARSLAWYAFDDRGMYRPGETVRVKGWVRSLDLGPLGGVSAAPKGLRKVRWKASDARGNVVAKGEADMGPLGGFDLRFDLPDALNLGQATLELRRGDDKSGNRHRHRFQVQEFRRPEFEVRVSAAGAPYLVGGHADLTVAARYFAGGGLPGAPATWRITTAPGSFTPPNRSDYSFGSWIPWWESRSLSTHDSARTRSAEGRTDREGRHRIRLDFEAMDPPVPTTVGVQGSVVDVNRQVWAARTTLLVHPASVYVGLKTERYFVARGEPLHVDAIVADLEGALVAGRPIAMEAVRLRYRWRKGKLVTEEKDRRTCDVVSGGGPVRCTFRLPVGGTWRIAASVRDPEGRPNRSTLTRWVSGAEATPQRTLAQQKVQLIPDKKIYHPGDVARILVQAPFTPAEGLLTLRRRGLVESRRFRMDQGSKVLEIPIPEAYLPNIHAQVDLVGSAPRLDADGEPDPRLPPRPAFAAGTLNLEIPPEGRRLTVEARPERTHLEPGASTSVELRVRDASGRPVAGAEVAIVVVDEAILALSAYKLREPLAVFYPSRGPGVAEHHSRSFVLLVDPEDLGRGGSLEDDEDKAKGRFGETRAEEEPVAGAAPPPESPRPRRMHRKVGADAGAQEPIAVRTNFDALAHFSPSVRTNSSGRARVRFKLPDSLTRYRVMAVAVSGADHFGLGESSITARLPLMARPSPPRFLNYGDRFELPVVIQNQTDTPLEVQVAVRAANASLTAGAGRKLTVPPNDRREVRFQAAAGLPGTARFQIAASSGPWADAAEAKLPVWTPATTEAFATYGVLDRGAVAQPVQRPPGVIEHFGGLEISTSSTALQALTDAVIYLVDYPYGCAEQIASRVLAVAALRDVLQAFSASGLPPAADLLAAVGRDLKQLHSMQNGDGGFGFWRRGERSWPFVSVHVAHALILARDKGFKPPARMVDTALRYLRRVEGALPSWYPEEVRRSIVAFSLYVRARAGDRDLARARRLLREAGGPARASLELVGWIYGVLAGQPGVEADLRAIRRSLGNRVTETAAGAHFASRYDDGAWLLLHSERRADAILLEGLIADQPRSDLIPKIVRGLLAHRSRGRWGSTQENAWVLQSLDGYFHAYEGVEPSFVARLWLGPRYAGEQSFRGRSTDRREIRVPMAQLGAPGEGSELLISKEGAGRLYYRVGLRYAPKDLLPPTADHGFVVQRTYEAVDDAADVRRGDDGVWRVRAGSRVRVRLTLVAPTRRYHVALVDPLPAGLEPLNAAIGVGETPPPAPEPKVKARRHARGLPPWWGWRWRWYEHENIRDERVEAFASLLPAGVHTYTYVARATTPGSYVAPPPKAEEMYHPETFGRGKGERLVVLP